MGTMQDFFYSVQELGKKIAETPLQMYEKKLSKMSDRQVVNEYWKQRRRNPNSKEYASVGAEITKRRVEAGHDEIVYTLGAEPKFDRGCSCTCTPKNTKNDKNKFWGR